MEPLNIAVVGLGRMGNAMFTPYCTASLGLAL
ncbi:hypothetical protein PENFLA_c001G04862 [Penicillium flavigenum]|uniref:Uncharacterized protein n=1 Tax=Penicillium flavigenum TaxID=254877 RepID=A0A1V6U3K5_9EURO|nr:hypothetical protein PENFLA_c001G04862 [Penicillium flavigenum]